MANGNEGPALGINVQADVGAAHPATIGAAGGLVGAIDQRTTIHGPTNTSWGIRGAVTQLICTESPTLAWLAPLK